MQDEASSAVSRRVLSRTAWTVPALVVLPTARAAAASCNSLPSVQFQGSWSNASISGFTSGPGFVGFNGASFGGNRDPAAGNGVAIASTQIVLELEPNRNYQLSFPVLNWYRFNAQTAAITVRGGGPDTTFDTRFASPGTIVHSFSTAASASITITLFFYVQQGSLGVLPGDDITLGSPTLRCV